MLTGYRTYLSALAIVVHQVFKWIGYDIPNDQVSIALDVLLGFLAVLFRYLREKRGDVK